MKVCVAGVGAIGGLLGFKLAKVGCEVTGIARGATLQALRDRGLRCFEAEAEAEVESVRIAVRDSTSGLGDLGFQDLVVIAVKSPALASLLPEIKPLVGPDTIVLPAINGVPWWFFQGFGGVLDGTSLRSIDPEGVAAKAIPQRSVVGCVVHCGASCPEPGLVRALARKHLIIGEPAGRYPAGGNGDRVARLAALLREAGFDVVESDRIQRDIWYKLWGNMTMNPISALTGATMDRILNDPLLAEFCRNIMEEARRVGAKIGCPIDQSVEERFAITRTLGAFKTSMLQDVEARKPVELDALLAAPVEIGALVEEPTPHMEILLGLARLHAKTLGLYPQD
jgi:2-dehydropantoate 2-reductase